MKIGIISIHYGVNFGSALQAYALPSYIKSVYPEIETEVINYIPPRYRFSRLYTYTSRRSLKKHLSWVIKCVVNFYTDTKYKRFLASMTNVSDPIYDFETAEKRYETFDCLIAGSDQIWNSDYNEGFDRMYYLCFASSNTKKIAYAASSGKNEFTEKEWDEMEKELHSFSNIGIRESSTMELFQKRGIECSFVLDPTYLLNRDEWARLEKKENIDGAFLLIYLLEIDAKEMNEIIAWANKLAKVRCLKTVLINNGFSSKKYDVDYVMWNKTPDSYVWLFRNASFVVTNSFHGTSFSINMERQFVVFKRHKYNTRLDSILGAMGLESRYVTLDNSVNVSNIDYEFVNERKEFLLTQSKRFINEALYNG